MSYRKPDFAGACSICNWRSLCRPTEGPSLNLQVPRCLVIVLYLSCFSKVGQRIERQRRQYDAID
jgi:hypothetical protein